jgi:hypothetical protein
VTALLSDFRFVKTAESILCRRPFHQMPVEKNCWHFTVLPLVKIEDTPSGESMEEFALRILSESREAIETVFLPKEICIRLTGWNCYDSGLCPQFTSDDGSLNEIRDHLRESLKKLHDRLIGYKGVESEMKDRNAKNSGNKCFGSIARAMCPSYTAAIRWKGVVTEKLEIRFNDVYLFISDEYLSNPSAHCEQQRIQNHIQVKTSNP